MENLAGRNDCDISIERELNRCGVEPVHLPNRLQSEVPASIIGKLGKFQFHRAWYYWVVQGSVPLNVAQELYNDPVGKTDIRVAGHCGCPPPEDPWITWRGEDGKKIIPPDQRQEAGRLFEDRNDLLQRFLEKYNFSDNPSAEGEGFIESYHIDSEVGLRLFADTLKKHNLT